MHVATRFCSTYCLYYLRQLFPNENSYSYILFSFHPYGLFDSKRVAIKNQSICMFFPNGDQVRFCLAFFWQRRWRVVVEELYPLLHINAFLTRPFQHAYISIIRSECGVGMLMCLLRCALFLRVPCSLTHSFIPTGIFCQHVTCPHWAKL